MQEVPMNGIGFAFFPLAILVVYGAGFFAVIYWAVRLAIRHERRP
jgi:hypothetical protein